MKKQRRARRVSAITKEERESIISGIVSQHKAGVHAAEIGEKYRIKAQLIRQLLREEGFDVAEPDPHALKGLHPIPHPMWEMDDDDRRLAIARRAKEGAKAARHIG